MPVYPGAAHGTAVNTVAPLPVAIWPGDSFDVFTAENAVAGQASVAVALGSVYENHPGTLSVELVFGGAPGAFEIDLQTSDTDADAFYTQEGLGITALTDSTAQTARGEFNNVSARFARLFIKTLANAVTVRGRIVRK